MLDCLPLEVCYLITDFIYPISYELRSDWNEEDLVWDEVAQNPRALILLEGRIDLIQRIEECGWNPHPEMKDFLVRHQIPLPELYMMVNHEGYHEEITRLIHDPEEWSVLFLSYPRIMEFEQVILSHPSCSVRMIGQVCFHGCAIPLLPKLFERFGVPTSSYFWSMLSKHRESFDIQLFKEIDDPRLHWDMLSCNTHPQAIQWLGERLHHPRICWRRLCANGAAAPILIPLLERNDPRLEWEQLSENANGELIQFIIDKQLFSRLSPHGCSVNTNPLMKTILEKYPHLQSLYLLLRNHSYDTLSLLDLKQLRTEDDFYPLIRNYISSHPYLFVEKKVSEKEKRIRWKTLFHRIL